ncbi:MAG: hypothetical protein JXA30_15100 [Deltaproteobacteria bacterium]|nr:hypothetical protein [Deltaproteobacteria bacterium]
MTLLQRLHPEAKRLVTPELASGELSRWSEQQTRSFVDPWIRPLSLEPAERVVKGVIERFEPFDTAIDAAAAPELHRSLPLSRAEAAEMSIWRFLAVVRYPELVRHRWENRSWASMRARFWASGVRPDSNLFFRLWWISELTRDGRDYSLTEQVLRKQQLATNIFVRALSAYRPAVAACVAVLSEVPAAIMERSIRDLNKALSTIVLEGCSEKELIKLLERIVGFNTIAIGGKAATGPSE